MNEIKTVIEKLKDKKNELEQANAADLESINNKQDNIDTLSKEISDLQNGIEERKKDIATLEQKMSEAESFDKSIGEVATLIEETEGENKEEVKEEVATETEVEVPNYPTFIPADEMDNGFTFNNNLDVFKETTPEVTEQTTEVQSAEEIPAYNEPVYEPEANETTFVPETNEVPFVPEVTETPDAVVNETTEPDVAPAMNDTATTPAFEMPSNEGVVNDYTMNEMYNDYQAPSVEESVPAETMSTMNDMYNPMDTPILR